MNQNCLKKKIQSSEVVLGSWITLAHPAIAEIMSRSGFDWLAVDLEHSVITIREAEELIRIIDILNVAPLVRLSDNDAIQIKRVMDAGSHGVIVPMVKNYDEAMHAVESVYYPTQGKRGVGLARAQRYGVSFAEYKEWLKENAVVVVQIEHIDAVKNLEKIFSIEQIDAFIVGPYDLSASMGVPGDFSDPNFLEALQQIKTCAQKLKKPGGLHIIEPNVSELNKRISEGYKFLAYSLDIRMLDVSCRSALQCIKK